MKNRLYFTKDELEELEGYASCFLTDRCCTDDERAEVSLMIDKIRYMIDKDTQENEIKELRKYIDKKIVESINKEEYSNIEVQEILEEIDSKIDDIRLIYGLDEND